MPELSDYLGLLPSANSTKEDFLAVLTALLEPGVDEQNTLASYVAKYDVEQAVGVQLDVVGQWVGFGRRVLAPIEGVYFSLDLPDVGLDQGVWWGPNDPLESLVSLDDETYRLMLLAKIASNYWDGSREQLQSIFQQFFLVSPGTFCFVIDNYDMTMTIGLSGVIPGAIFQKLFLKTHVPLPPAAVGANVIVTTVTGTPIFGFDIDNDYLGGLDHGAWYASVEV